MAFSVESLSSAILLTDVALSKDGSKVIYRAEPRLKTGEHPTASLWYSSQLGKAESAKQITSGLYEDDAPQWDPNGETIFFLSDRHKPGGPKQIYKLSIDGPGEASLLNETFKEKKRAIKSFQVSPDGNYIGFISADEPSAEDEKEEEEKDDAKVWGDPKLNQRLRLYTISTGQVRTLIQERNVTTLFWSPDSKQIAYILSARAELAANYETTSLHTVSILPGSGTAENKHIMSIKNSPIYLGIWPSENLIYSLQTYTPGQSVDALAIHQHSLQHSDGSVYQGEAFYAGDNEDATGLHNIRSSSGELAVVIAAGMDTRVDILNNEGDSFTLISTECRGGFGSLDIKKVGEDYVFAGVYSSGPNMEAPAVWVGKSTRGKTLKLETKLFSHFQWLKEHKLGSVEIFEWKGEDGVDLNGMAWFPANMRSSNLKTPLPTILHIHGGPYSRSTPDLTPGWVSWAPFLAERGYLVLQPNYRGSSGRGSKFARAAYHGMGSIEWSDINLMVEEAIRRGLSDKGKLGIGGWSQGGFLTAWGVSQTKNKFRCGIMGAGVSDWGAMATESDMPEFEVELSNAAPWLGFNARLAGDPIRHVEDVETAVLIIHGERDLRVPVGQGIGFHRGLRRRSKYPDRHILVTYPREPHGFTESKHGQDVLRRLLEHCDAWLK